MLKRLQIIELFLIARKNDHSRLRQMSWCKLVRQHIPEYRIQEIIGKFCSQALILEIKLIIFGLYLWKDNYGFVTCLLEAFYSLFVFDNHLFLTVFEIIGLVEIVNTPSAR